MSNIRCSSFQDSSNSRRKDLERVRTNTQVSDMRIWHVDTSARLLAGGARGLGDLCYARTEVERRAHEMQTFLHELRKLKNANEQLTQTEKHLACSPFFHYNSGMCKRL